MYISGCVLACLTFNIWGQDIAVLHISMRFNLLKPWLKNKNNCIHSTPHHTTIT